MVGTLCNEDRHRERRWMVRHCFLVTPMPELELVILIKTALLLQGLEERSGNVVNMLH
jgi:hypothetical protein